MNKDEETEMNRLCLMIQQRNSKSQDGRRKGTESLQSILTERKKKKNGQHKCIRFIQGHKYANRGVSRGSQGKMSRG